MGLRVDIYRSDYDSTGNVFHGKRAVIVTNLPGPFTPTPACPAAVLGRDGLGGPAILPDVADYPPDCAGPMFGGTLAYTSDSRFGHGPLPIHDRFETWDMYDRLSR